MFITMLKHKKLANKKIFLAVAVVVITAVFGLWLWQKDSNDKFTPGPSSNAQTKGEVSADTKPSSKDSAQSPGDSNQPADNKNSTSGTTSTLIAPSGNFVSNHSSSLDAAQSSDCTTTPGATCKITFTKDGVTKSLEERTTDRGGAAYWSWKPQDIGLSEGTWEIKAVASLNGKTLTSDDALKLTLAP